MCLFSCLGEGKTGGHKYDAGQHRLFAASGFRSPLESLTNLVSLLIDEELLNITPAELQPISLVSLLNGPTLLTPTTRAKVGEKGKGRVASSLNADVYEALAHLPQLQALSTGWPPDQISKLQALQSLSIQKHTSLWHVPNTFPRMTNLVGLYVQRAKATVLDVPYLPFLQKITFGSQVGNLCFLALNDNINAHASSNLACDECELGNKALLP